jgi:hypothetical protein
MSAPDFAVVTFKWKPAPGYRSQFRSEHVNTLRRMVARNFNRPHRFICITDDAEGLDPEVEVVPLWKDHGDLKSPHGAGNPSCYRRLRLFARDAADIVGPRFVCLDLDCVVTGDLTPLFTRPEDFLVWGMTNPNNPYNGSFMLLNAGARPQVWEGFDPVRSPAEARRKGFFGSDQAWLCASLGPDEARVNQADGVFSYRLDCKPITGGLPPGARIVFFHGQHDPWGPEAQRLNWVREHYR